MSFPHKYLVGDELHYPQGHSLSGVALVLEPSSSNSYVIQDDTAKYSWLTLSTNDNRVVWGDLTNTANPQYWWIIQKNHTATWRVKDTDGTIYLDIDTTTGSQAVKIGYDTCKLGFFAASPVAQQTVGAVTNSVTAGGSTGVIADYSSLTVYATDAAAIRNNIYQLARAVAQLTTAVRAYGLGA